MVIECVWEHNGNDTLLHAVHFPGAYTRGASKEIALRKMPGEVRSYLLWKGAEIPKDMAVTIVQESSSELPIKDADSDVLFDTEKIPLTEKEYISLKELVLKSAEDFLFLYNAIPDRDKSDIPVRKTFYGQVPRTANEMYIHTKNVNRYYFGEINVNASNDGTILECRRRGLAALEKRSDFLKNSVFKGSYGEYWTLRKVLRRFLWHDRIHAKAMYRMAVRLFGKNEIPNVFAFED